MSYHLESISNQRTTPERIWALLKNVMKILSTLFRFFRRDTALVPNELKDACPATSLTAPESTRQSGANRDAKAITDAIELRVTISSSSGTSPDEVSPERVAQEMDTYQFVLDQNAPRVLPERPWCDYQSQEQLVTANSPRAYAWLEPFLPPVALADEGVQKAAQRGVNNIKRVAIALRALVRTQRRTQKPYEELLLALYRVCALEQFCPSLRFEYEYPAQMAGYVCVSDWEQAIPDYATLGYAHILTLGKTDIKWLVAAFGEAWQHEAPERFWEPVRRKAICRLAWTNAAILAKEEPGVPIEKHLLAWLAQRIRGRLWIDLDNEAYHAGVAARREREHQAFIQIDDAWAAAAGECVVADIETTGLSAESNELLEVGAIKLVNGKPIAEWSMLVRIERIVPSNITELTGITQADVDREGQPLTNVMTNFLDFVSDKPVFFHNTPFDERFLRKAAERCFLSFENRLFDTLILAQAAWPDLRSYRLATLADHIGVTAPNHRALPDAHTTLAVMRAAQSAAGKVGS